jgi:pantoate--beta-alanine ligase
VRVIENLQQLRESRPGWAAPVGFVPTMGYLHQGHLSLIRRARAECATVVVSIYVNPTQFGPNEDFGRYPRALPADLRLCEQAGVDAVFTPGEVDVYPPGFRTFVEVRDLQDRWEGASRPGHFVGVATVVARLFRLIQPGRAYFGEKDYQQLQIVRRLSQDLNLEVEVVACPTVREPDGLACSSRNVYLSADDRARAASLFLALTSAQRALDGEERSGRALQRVMAEVIAETEGAVLDYAAVVDPESLAPLELVQTEARALIAVRLGGVHLIDNAPLVPPSSPRFSRPLS